MAGADPALALAGARLLRTFDGHAPSPAIVAAIAARQAAGVSLYRARNIAHPSQVRELTAALQAARPAGDPALLIAIDQEGGQLQAVGDPATAWPGNLALAATRSAELARRTGAAIGLELAALGVNVNFAPVADLLDDPRNPVMGTRTFGDDPRVAGDLAAAFVEGIQAAGVAATLKHFPGHGAVAGDSHHALPVLAADRILLRSRELVPFVAGLAADVRLVMLAHLAVPGLTGRRDLPATLAADVVALLRDELGFAGVTVSDALDMGALAAFGALPQLAVAAAAAGIDLLLANHPADAEAAAFEALADAIRSGRPDAGAAQAAAARVHALRQWLGGPVVQPDVSVVGSRAHLDLARETAERSITLLRDRTGLLPLSPGRRLLVVAPRATDLTPADTSSYLELSLAGALRLTGCTVDEIGISLDPADGEIRSVVARADGLREAASQAADQAPIVVVGTVDALVHRSQARLVEALVSGRVPVVAVALRAPVDLVAYPGVGTALATYGQQAPSLVAVAAAIAGRIPLRGRLPVRLPAGFERA
ncbi:MAG TPA: glycoside hydrolase family 3 N-terminal domain-containing protein [Candidatus Limnocylindrales bacterium]|nr:glycoside hydrolase family 3 N-terminal domain-containing protein [Candidatus Limnocylindrales bacterium]